MAARVPNCSAIVRGAWLGSMIPPAPSRIVRVCAPTCAISTLVAEEAMLAHVVVLGVPDPLVAELLGPLGQRHAGGEAVGGGLTPRDRRQVEDRKRDTHYWLLTWAAAFTA